MRHRASRLLSDIERIYRAARASEDGRRCCVAPAPELQDRMIADLERLRARAKGPIKELLKIKAPTKVGLNDGLIVPGDALPLGSPPSVAREVALDRAPLRGDIRVIAVLVDFADRPMAETREHFEQLFFSTGVLPDGSVREYFAEVSHGLVNITGQVVGPYRLPRTLAQYANGASGTGPALPNARTMARDAAEAANPHVNFAPYDNDGNGYVDAFIIIHAGPGGEVTGNAGHIWSHKWVLPGGDYNADGTRIFAYLTIPEDARIGVCAHELGHLLFGWPDLYDSDYSSSGLGQWCLMAGGSWNGNGDVPCHPSAWCKVTQGWVSVVSPTGNADVSIADVKSGHQVYRLWKDGGPGSEYFLVENRQRTDYDRLMPGAGLLIYHVDDTISSNADEAHPKVALMQADGRKQLESGANRGDPGDAYPGAVGNTVFNATSTPNSKSYGGMDTSVSVASIGPSGPVMTARIAVRAAPPKPAKERVKDKAEKEGKEGFEKRQPEKRQPEKRPEKQPEKPVNEKAARFDKRPSSEKTREKFRLFDGRFWAPEAQPPEAAAQFAALEERLALIEEALLQLEPFIGGELRPDLSEGALAEEDDLGEARSRMLEGSVQAKRLMDTKPTDR